MDLAENIFTYYKENYRSLRPDKLFHFATRMAAWRGDDWAFEKLRDSRERITEPQRPLRVTLKTIIDTPQIGRRNAHELRAPFFEKYPLLFGAHAALFRVRHLEAVYNIDARQALFDNISDTELSLLRDQLLADDNALQVLSTFAINYIYLLERVVHRNNESIPVEHFLEIGEQYEMHNPLHSQLLIYLYTHCIIGDSNFYTREVPRSALPLYQSMLAQLETVIADRYDDINLDNKLEFLVCARICHYTTSIDSRIYAECHKSISPDGMFIVDTCNNNAQVDRANFNASEHRNILLIMSTTPYSPHSTLVDERL